MELLIESSCYRVSWKVKDFFQLPSEIGYTLNSPKFHFDDDSYCLQLKSNGEDTSGETDWRVNLLRLTSVTERNVVSKLGQRLRVQGQEFDYEVSNAQMKEVPIHGEKRDEFVPDGTFTLLCSMRLGEQSRAGSLPADEAKRSNRKEKHEGLPGQSTYFNSCWRSTKMELAVESPCQYITLKVPHFSKLPSEIGFVLESNEFHFEGDSYCLRFYPNGDRNYKTAYICYQLVRLTSNFPERNVSYKIGYRYRNVLDKYFSTNSLKMHHILRSEIEGKRDVYVSDDTFTLVCSMLLKEQSSVGRLQSEESEAPAEKEQKGLPAESISRKFTTCAVQTEDANSVIGRGNTNDEEWTSLDIKDDTLLRERMKELLTKGIEQDITICVQHKEYRAHRNILSARSPVFAMMLTHDSKEKITGKIKIEDCDPESFEEFLLYLYSGRTENLTPTNALQLYYPADKYDFPVLKERCVRILKTSLSVESICDVALLAAKYQEKELLEVATEFFARNMKKILVTVNWQKFMLQNPVVANELLIKSMDIKDSEK